MTIAEDIRKASDKLTEETWTKGRYFRIKNDKLCMCAHGAVASVCNRIVVDILATIPKNQAWEAPDPAALGAAVARAVGRAADLAVARASDLAVALAADPEAGLALGSRWSDGWENRPRWVKDSGLGASAHYILGMVGLTLSYNDAESRTLAEVKAKLEEAAQLAERLGV